MIYTLYISYIYKHIYIYYYIKLTDFNPLNNFTAFDLPDNQIKREKSTGVSLVDVEFGKGVKTDD